MWVYKDNIKKNYVIHFFIYLLLINFIFFISLKIAKNESKFSPYSPEIKNIIIKDGKFAKIGIISDFQLDKNNNDIEYKYYANNLYQALKFFKKNKIDILIIPGDTTNNGQITNYLYFKEIFYSVYNNIQKPIIISIMGNNDYRDKKLSILENQNKFYKYMNSYPYSHYIINNYNFIFWSNDNQKNTEKGVQDFSWIKSTLEEARKRIYKKGDPIFVITHMPPLHTIYGSELVHKGIFEILKNYPEVICISGHSHHSLKNKKSIWQGEFTAVNTQSISYISIDKIFQNIQDVYYDSINNHTMGLLAYLNEDSVTFDRIDFFTEEAMEKSWKINFPIIKSNFIYNFEKRNNNIKPSFTDNNEIKIEKVKNKNFILFNAASHEDYVYYYKIILNKKHKKKNNIELYYYSDYYKNKIYRNETLKYELPNDIKSGKYDVEIYAYDSFDNVSKPKIGVIDI